MTNVALGAGRDVIGRLSGRHHTVVTRSATIGRTNKNPAQMAGLAGHGDMGAIERESGVEMVKCRPGIRFRLRASQTRCQQYDEQQKHARWLKP